ncbi:MAG: dimethylsulfonioproprionate lyase family protein [Bacteroidales bacterium]
MSKQAKQDQLWYKFLAGFIYEYESLSASGNETIRFHMESVLNKFDNLANNPAIQGKEPSVLPVTDYLIEAIKREFNRNETPIFQALKEAMGKLSWEYGYDELPEDLKNKYGFCEIIGPNGNLYSEKIISGLMLLAPGCHYPNHKHDNLEKSYICLSGEVSVNNCGVFRTNSLIYTAPGEIHKFTTGKFYSCLLLFSLIGNPEDLKKLSVDFQIN